MDEVNPDLNSSIVDCEMISNLPIPRDLYPLLWQPPTHIPNAISATTAVSPVKNELFFINPFGNMGHWVIFEVRKIYIIMLLEA